MKAALKRFSPKYSLIVCFIFLLTTIDLAHASNEQIITGTRVFVGDCLSTNKRLKGLPIPLIGSVLKFGISKIGQAMSNAATEKTVYKTARANFEFSNNSEERLVLPECIQFVYGEMRLSPIPTADEMIRTNYLELNGDLSSSGYRNLRDMGLFLNRKPHFFFEGRLVPSDLGSHFTVRTNLIRYNKSLGTGSGKRDLVLSFVFQDPSQADIDGSGQYVTISFEELKTKSALDFYGSAGLSPAPVETPWIEIPAAKGSTPYSLTVRATEVRNANKFLQGVSLLLTNNQSRIEELIDQKISERFQ